MCGIACFVGKNAPKNCFEALKKLEYRGYDSAGIAGLKDEKISLFRHEGGVDNIKNFASALDSNFVVSHTRWATHGDPSEKNAHPHLSYDKNFALVHNGIIENYKKLKTELLEKKIPLYSDTDSEVIASTFAAEEGSIIEKAMKTRKKLVGSYALGILCRREKKVLALRNKSPLYIAKTDDGVMIASDIVCFFSLAKEFYSLKENEVALVDEKGYEVYDEKGFIVEPTMTKIDENAEEISLMGYSHFMEKEINEIPNVIKRLEGEYIGFKAFEKVKYLFENIQSIAIIGCGTAYHASMFGAKILQDKLRIPCHAYIASELKYSSPIVDKTLGIFVSQSGETADTLGCLELFKSKGARTLAITNVSHSTLARGADKYISVFAGAEIAVASTKAYVAQIITLMLLASYLGGEKENILHGFAEKTKQMLKIDKDIVSLVSSASRVFFIGRQLGSITSLEAALKLKEISYMSAEGYPAGELKHGTIALIEEGTPVVVFLTDEKVYDKTLASAEETRSRGAKIILVAPEKFSTINCDYFIKLPEVRNEWLYGALAIIPFQILAYEVSLKMGYNPDKPRNLAKAVTVE